MIKAIATCNPRISPTPCSRLTPPSQHIIRPQAPAPAHDPRLPTAQSLPSLIPKPLLLIEQIRPRRAQIDDLRATVPILLEPRALEAIKSVADAFAAADRALILVVAERALVADAHQRCRAHVRVAHGALAVAFVAEAPDGDARLLAAHH